jgi:hypothetical protein
MAGGEFASGGEGAEFASGGEGLQGLQGLEGRKGTLFPLFPSFWLFRILFSNLSFVIHEESLACFEERFLVYHE